MNLQKLFTLVQKSNCTPPLKTSIPIHFQHFKNNQQVYYENKQHIVAKNIKKIQKAKNTYANTGFKPLKIRMFTTSFEKTN